MGCRGMPRAPLSGTVGTGVELAKQSAVRGCIITKIDGACFERHRRGPPGGDGGGFAGRRARNDNLHHSNDDG